MFFLLLLRRIWANYFKENKIRYLFWSAVNAQKIIDEEHKKQVAEAAQAALEAERAQREAGDDDDGEVDEEIEVIEEGDEEDLIEEDEEGEGEEEEEDEGTGGQEGEVAGEDDEDQWEDYESDEEGGDGEEEAEEEAHHEEQGEAADPDEDIRVLTREELLDRLVQLCREKTDDARNIIGFVGYPNVGKSSTINVLCQAKKVAVAATPGKTKHFQTLNIEPNITLCDCPGLVFPNFAATKAEMVCNGVLPIDQLKDPFGPSALVAQRIPRKVVEAIYGIRIIQPAEGEDPNRKPTASELLSAYACK